MQDKNLFDLYGAAGMILLLLLVNIMFYSIKSREGNIKNEDY
jgi:DMSO/TMAO reductase YedYZ heme-binding membrane subunit